jgi:hypothetical protein
MNLITKMTRNLLGEFGVFSVLERHSLSFPPISKRCLQMWHILWLCKSKSIRLSPPGMVGIDLHRLDGIGTEIGSEASEPRGLGAKRMHASSECRKET